MTFEGTCWRCWPKLCKCLPPETEIEKIKQDWFIAERAWIEERKRRRDAELVVKKILDDICDISLPEIIDAARKYAEKYGKQN